MMYNQHNVQSEYGRRSIRCQEGGSKAMSATGSQDGFARTGDAVEGQLRAMNSELYEVGLFRPASGDNQAEMLPRTWDQRTLLDSVSWLRWQNSQDRNLYSRPSAEPHSALGTDQPP